MQQWSELTELPVYGPNRKGTGFEQPLGPHQHWHVDISHVNIAGTFYYLCSVLDGLALDLPVRLRIVGRGADVGHAGDVDEALEVLGDELTTEPSTRTPSGP